MDKCPHGKEYFPNTHSTHCEICAEDLAFVHNLNTLIPELRDNRCRPELQKFFVVLTRRAQFATDGSSGQGFYVVDSASLPEAPTIRGLLRDLHKRDHPRLIHYDEQKNRVFVFNPFVSDQRWREIPRLGELKVQTPVVHATSPVPEKQVSVPPPTPPPATLPTPPAAPATQAQQGAPAQVKRKRGRPRRNALPQPSSAPVASAASDDGVAPRTDEAASAREDPPAAPPPEPREPAAAAVAPPRSVIVAPAPPVPPADASLGSSVAGDTAGTISPAEEPGPEKAVAEASLIKRSPVTTVLRSPQIEAVAPFDRAMDEVYALSALLAMSQEKAERLLSLSPKQLIRLQRQHPRLIRSIIERVCGVGTQIQQLAVTLEQAEKSRQ